MVMNRYEPIVASADELIAALDVAALPPLLPALAALTGDLSLLRDDLRTDPMLAGMPQGGLSEDQQRAIRALALDVLVAFRDGGSVPASPPGDDDLLRIMQHTVGSETTGQDMADYLPLLHEELAWGGRDRREPDWTLDDLAPGRQMRASVIGAGMSGLLAAHRLQQAGMPFVIVEKDDDVGGTWLENSYPGCRVDISNHTYSYSFAQRHDWPQHFSTQDVLLEYFRDCAERFGVRDHIRFGTEVVSATWSDDEARWSVEVCDGEGRTETLEAEIVISAVGQLNRPRYPDIEGRELFEGPAFHSARWDHDLDLTGKRVAVIGTGASAMQLAPEIAPLVDRLLVFQRSPAWLLPTPDYHDDVDPGLTWLYRHVPLYSELNRFWMFWRMGDGALAGVRVDPSWDKSLGSISVENELGRLLFTEYLKAELAGRPDLFEKCLPDYPVGSKRIVRDNGAWPAMLRRDDVELITDPIARIEPPGVVTADGTLHEVDVLIYGTGFAASDFLTPMTVTGVGGLDLHQQWAGDATAYLGLAVPGFPNLFCLYGPNTNIVVNGSIIYFSECGVRFIQECVRTLLETGHRAMSVRPEVLDEFRGRVDAQNRCMAWGLEGARSWYKNANGTVTQNWPFTLLEYWQRTAGPDLTEFEFIS